MKFARAESRVLIATFVTLGLAYGFWYSYAVFLVAFLRDFGWSRSVVAGAFSVLLALGGLRALQTHTGDHLTGNWSWVPYLAALVALAILIALGLSAIRREGKAKARR